MNTTAKPVTLAVTSTSTGQLCDRYGRLKADAADLSAELDSIKTVLIEREGEGKFEGELFRLSLAHTLRSTTDWKAIAAALAAKAGIKDKELDAMIALHTDCTASWVARSNARVTKAA